MGCYPSLFRLGNICNPVLVVIFHIDSLFLKIQGLPKIITTNCVQNEEKKYANWFFCIINMYTKYTLAVCVFMFYWFFLLSLNNECLWKVTTSTGLLILGSLIKTIMFTLLDACAGELLDIYWSSIMGGTSSYYLCSSTDLTKRRG